MPADPAAIRVLLVDDRPAVRCGLRMRLALEPDLVVVGEAGDGAEAIRAARASHPDVVLLDLAMPGLDGLEVTAALRTSEPRCAVVILTLHDDTASRTRARAVGAAAFVGKHEGAELLLAAIRRAAPRPKQG